MNSWRYLKSLMVIFFITLTTDSMKAQNLILSESKGGVVQYSSNGKGNWKNCQVNSEVSGYVKIPKNVSAIFSSIKLQKSVLWKKEGVFKMAEIEQFMNGYNNDAAATLWHYVNQHSREHSKSIAGVHRGEDDYFILIDSSIVSAKDTISFDLDNEMKTAMQFNLKCKGVNSNWSSDTIIYTKSQNVNYFFNQSCNCVWGIGNWESPNPQTWYHLFVIDEQSYDREKSQFHHFLQSIADYDAPLKEAIILYYCQEKKLPLLSKDR